MEHVNFGARRRYFSVSSHRKPIAKDYSLSKAVIPRDDVTEKSMEQNVIVMR